MNVVITLFLLMLLGCSDTVRSEKSELLLINEVMVKNHESSGAFSPEGKYEDYIELFNAGADSVWLNHYFLSDDVEVPTKRNLPVRQLAPGDFALFYGGRFEKYPEEYLGFSLSGNSESGDVVLLVNQEITVIDSLDYLRLNVAGKKGESLGRLGDGGTVWSVQKRATPGRPNNQ